MCRQRCEFLRMTAVSKSVVFSESKKTVGLMGIARETVEGLVARAIRLDEQGADSLRIDAYVRRWRSWVNGGLGRNAPAVCHVDVCKGLLEPLPPAPHQATGDDP